MERKMLTKPGRFDYQLVLSVAEFKFHCVKLGEHWNKLLEFGSTKDGETCCEGFERTQRANCSSVAVRSRQAQWQGETCSENQRASHGQRFGLSQPFRIVRTLDVCGKGSEERAPKTWSA